MYEIFKTSIAQMGAVGLLLSFAGIVIYWLREDNKAKDETIKQEILKREALLREVLESHQEALDAIKGTSDSLSSVINRVEDTVERIEGKVNEGFYKRQN